MTDASGGTGASDGTDASDPGDAAAAVARARERFADAAAALLAAGARRELRAEFVPERRVLGIPRAARMAALGEVWRLGALLLDAGGTAYATGRVVRAERPARRSITAASVAEQRALQAAAVKGGIAAGTTVVFDAPALDLDELGRSGAVGPLVLAAGEVLVRWSPTQPGALTPLYAYLRDRVDLLVHPPQGA
ncbi:hypothetical protein GE115_05195 [Agromyces sp. CFH 90414]|uniref:Glutaminase n=1 Tax=Agromyces agglutinans TaxID=2662258 RepID=A0A6I2F693_9MICO|nr:hypothetical protein [Agromyces agglutinans]MRG59267.1 hypothetical protein [Agromyces agglutinans]